MQKDHSLQALLSLLKAKKPQSPITSVVNPSTINLTCNLLSKEDYVNVAGQLNDASDLKNVLDFMLCLLSGGHLSDADVNLRARRLMLKAITKTPVMPRSLFVTGVKVKIDRDYIASGGFGLVFKGELGGRFVALKVLYKAQNNIDACREALMWRSLNHKFVLPFLGIYEHEPASQFFLVSPYMENGTLAQWRKKANPSVAEIEERILEVAQGIEYIHSQGVVHGDLRGANILLDAEFHVQIADFGLTRLSEATSTQSGALHYNFAAPELFGYTEPENDEDDDMARTYKSDVFAFGRLYYEIYYGTTPFAGIREIQVMKLVCGGVHPPRLDEPPLSDWVWELIRWCWDKEAMRRPLISDVAERMMATLGSNSRPLPFLLSILNRKKSGAPITSVVNATSIDLLRRLLSKEDYLNVTEGINHGSDAKNILDFMLYVLHNRYLSDPDGIVDTNRRARRLMANVITKARVMPRSLFLTGVTVSIDRENAGPGPVLKGELRGAQIALRVVHKTRNDLDFCKEALMWRSLNHKFVLPFLGIYEEESPSCFFLVSPYMKNGTLTQWRKSANPSTAEIEERILEVAQGIEYVHSEGIIHGELCGDNILLDFDLRVQISDFGLARLSEPTGRALNYSFAAPELFECVGGDDSVSDKNALSTEKTQKSDVYAFGCLYYEIHYDQTPFAGEEGLRIKELVSEGELPLRLAEQPLSDGAWELIQTCWIKQAANRPAIKEVLERMEAILKIQRNSDRRPLLSLLSILREREPASPITSVVTTTSIDLFCNLLSRDDYDDTAEALTNPSDATILLDFMLYMIRNHSFPDPEESLKTKRRARKLMSEIVKKVPLIPNSLVLAGITLPAERTGAGSVVKGGLHGSPVTVKVLNRTRDNDIQEFCREALTWGSLQHKFVLPFLGICEPESTSQLSFLVTPFTPNGTLAQWRKKTHPRPWEVEKRILEVARGIHYLHLEGVVHGDLCGDNIFLDSDLHAQIADFGLSQHSYPGTLRYSFAAPELLEQAKSAPSGSRDPIERTEASDIYAFGCLYYEIHYNSAPFAHIEDTQTIQLVLQGDLPFRLDNPPMSEDAWRLIRRCWVDKWRRPAIRDIVKTMKSWKMAPGGSSTSVSTYSQTIPRTPIPAPSHLPSRSSNLSLPAEEGTISVAIDFGTALSGVAYYSARSTNGEVRQVLKWPGSNETFRKIPTCLLYDRNSQVTAWGLEAKNANPIPDGAIRCEWFKLLFESQMLHSGTGIDARLPVLPQGKQVIDLISDFLRCMWQYAKDEIRKDTVVEADLNVCFTVPAAWNPQCCDRMREAATKAGFVQDHLHIVTESEAAANFLADIHNVRPGQNFVILDAGGGTCDVAVYQTSGRLANPDMNEISTRSGQNCGSIFLDLRFRELVELLLFDHPVHRDEASLAHFLNLFSRTEKLTYHDDRASFFFTCLNSVDPNDSSAFLVDGQLVIPGNLLHDLVFDPVVNQVLALIEEQVTKMDQPVDALLIVGGFAENEYLKKRIEDKFASKIGIIERPTDADTVILQGAAQHGLSKKQLMASVTAPRSYMIKVKLPAEREDLAKRPTYIIINDAGARICQNRLQYLLVKGATIRKGQRPTFKFCKFSHNALDSMFVTTIFASESHKVLRYTDEGETTEVCKWTVDLSSLPTFKQNSTMHKSGGFYTEFELGLELDNVEVRGVLMYKERPWESVTLDFF